MLSTEGIAPSSVTNLGADKLLPRYIGPFTVTFKRGDAYTLDIPTSMRLHPTFNVSRLKKYYATDMNLDADGLAPSRNRITAPSSSSSAAIPAADLGARGGAAPSTPDETAQANPSAAGSRGVGPRATPSSRRSRSPSRQHSPRRYPCSQGDASGVAPQLEAARSRRPQCSPGRTHSATPADDSRDTPPARSGAEAAAPPPRDHASAQEARRSEAASPAPTPIAQHPRTASPHGAENAAPPTFVRDGPPPLFDSEGNERWVVDRIVDHADPKSRSGRRRSSSRGIPSDRQYLVRWLGYPPDADTWEPRAQLLDDIRDAVTDYELAQARRA